MSDSNQTLGVDIKITKSGAGATEGAQELRNLTSATKDAGHAQDQLNQHQEEGGKKSEKLEVNHRELLRIFSQLGPVGMEAGHAMLGALEGGLGYGVALAVAIKLVVDYFEDLKQKAEEAAKPLEGAQELANVFREAAQHAAEYEDHLENIITHEKELADSLRRQREERTLLLQLQGKVKDAERVEAEARINLELANGQITPEKAAAAKLKLRLGADQQHNNEANATAQGKIEDLQKQYADALFNKDSAAKAVENAGRNAETEKARRANAAGLVKEIDKLLPGLKEQMEKAEEKVKEIEGNIQSQGPGWNPALKEIAEGQLAKAQRELEGASGNYNSALSSRQKEQGILDSPDLTAQKLKQAEDALSGIVEKLATLSADLESARQGKSAIGDAGNKTFAADVATELFKFLAGNRNTSIGKTDSGAPITLGFLSDVENAQNAVRNHQQLTEAQRETLRVYADMMNAQLNHNAATREWIVRFVTEQNDQAAQLRDLLGRFGMGS